MFGVPIQTMNEDNIDFRIRMSIYFGKFVSVDSGWIDRGSLFANTC